MNDLPQLIVPELVLINPKLTSSEEVIERLGGLLVEGGFGKETLIDAALERERLYPTGLLLDSGGVNAAIPHADREHVNRPAVAVATLDHPVVFHRMDDPDAELPVRLVFLLALPDADSQLQTLRTLTRALQSAELISQLASSATPAELISAVSESGART